MITTYGWPDPTEMDGRKQSRDVLLFFVFRLEDPNIMQKYTENAKILLNSITILSGIANSIDNMYINGSIYHEIHQLTRIRPRDYSDHD